MNEKIFEINKGIESVSIKFKKICEIFSIKAEDQSEENISLALLQCLDCISELTFFEMLAHDYFFSFPNSIEFKLARENAKDLLKSIEKISDGVKEVMVNLRFILNKSMYM